MADGTELDGAKNLTITATGKDAMTTKATGGASAGTGSLALSAQVAIAISNVTTTASIGTGNDLALATGGSLTAHATQNVTTTTNASGATKGGNAGIGLSLGLLVADHVVLSQIHRNLTASNAASFAADGASANDTEANASDVGSQEAQNSTSADNKTDSTGKDVNKKADDNLAVGDNTSKDSTKTTDNPSGTGASTTKTPDATSGESGKGSSGGTKVTVAAAAAIALVTAQAIASPADGLSITSSGALTLKTSEDVDSKVIGKASATKAQKANIGASVAINLVKVTNQASTGLNDLLSVKGLFAYRGGQQDGCLQGQLDVRHQLQPGRRGQRHARPLHEHVHRPQRRSERPGRAAPRTPPTGW